MNEAQAQTEDEFEPLQDGVPAPEDPVEEQPAEEPAGETKPEPPPGFVTQEEWNEQGNDPDRWVPLGAYERIHDLIQQNKSIKGSAAALESQMKEMVVRNNRFHDQQVQVLERQNVDLQKDLSDAITDADSIEAMRIQTSIDANKASINNLSAPIPRTASPPAPSPALTTWNEANTWIDDDTPKAAFARAVYTRHLAANVSTANDAETLVSGAIKSVEAAVAREFPPTNPNRANAPAALRGRNTSSGNRGETTLAWDSMTRREKEGWETFGKLYKDKAEYLKTVQEGREGV